MYFCTCNFVTVILPVIIHFCYHVYIFELPPCGRYFNKIVFGKQLFISFPATSSIDRDGQYFGKGECNRLSQVCTHLQRARDAVRAFLA